MSFDINPPRNLSNVQASAKTCSGGGGNTGYFRRDNGEGEDSFKFSKDSESDSFVKEGSEQGQEISIIEDIKKFLKDIIRKIKAFFKIK